ncbi:hypothetical protein AJ87_30510 [Rhizobium yanglingense]|nr:hypothetical protein AJ87_30510 [Rhizobium yanglingense]
MQKIVTDTLRPDGGKDPHGVQEARGTHATAYGMIEQQLGSNQWITGDSFTMADCAAAPALFYAETLVPSATTSRSSAPITNACSSGRPLRGC